MKKLRPSSLLYSTYETRVVKQFEKDQLPKHVAVLADGNRRWARMNAPDQPLVTGYQAGADKLRQLVSWCAEVGGIEVVTLWVLSTDNLSRSAEDELDPLLGVIADLVASLSSSGLGTVQLVGDVSLLPDEIASRMLADSQASQSVAGPLHINIAVAYGGRHEIRNALRELLADAAHRGITTQELAETLETDQIAQHLYTAGQPDPDLLIRTSGEQRLSGFMMWQSAHSELYFCEALWPDFRRIDFYRALRSFSQRERRYGK